MKSASKQLLISGALKVRTRYVRAVNIERDLGDEHALDGYLLTDAVRQSLARLGHGLQTGSAQRAWRITGGYGGGKSSFGLFLTSLFTQPLTKKSVAAKLLSTEAPELLAQLKKLPRYEPLVITGARTDASVALVAALLEAVQGRRASPARKALLEKLTQFIDWRSRRELSPHVAIELLKESAAFFGSGANASEGLLLVIDEMGRWLEYAAEDEADLDASFFQSLAETCGGKARGIPIAIVGILHQRFEDYVQGRRDRRSGVEWAKVAERFEDITFSQSQESTSHLVARALEADKAAYQRAGILVKAKALYGTAEAMGLVHKQMPDHTGDVLYPFHPVALAAAISIFRRFGQNERSTFSFLLSSEPFGFQEFIGRHALSDGTWYRVHNLCDYLLAQGTLRSADEERLKRWALLQEVLRAAPVYEELEVKCLKTVGLLNLLEPQPGLPVSIETIAFAIKDDAADKSVRTALNKLVSKSLLYVRPATQELCLWPQSSIDVANELARIRKAAPNLLRLGGLIDSLPAARPIVAHKHYIEKGTLRAAQVSLVDDIEGLDKRLAQPQQGDAQILIVPIYPDQSFPSIAKRVGGLSAKAPEGTILSLRKISEADLETAEELLSWKQLERDCAELRIDPYARTEVQQAIHRLTNELIHRLADLRVPSQGGKEASWWHRGEHLPITDGRSLNRNLSKIFESLYSKAPAVRNELINRSAISTAAAAARQRLLERMFTHESQEDLGIEMTPPEKAIYLSVLRESGLHAHGPSGWFFRAPSQDSDWAPAWNELHRLLTDQGLISVEQVIKHFAGNRFGMRESVVLLLIGAFLRVHRQDLILRERGTYLTQVEESHLARLIKRPESFELHMVNAQTSTLSALNVYREVLNAHLKVEIIEPTVGEITRYLYQWYLSLTEHTLNSAQLDPRHRVALGLMGKAGDPVDLLTVGLPFALGVVKKTAPIDAKSKVTLEVLRGSFRGFLEAGSGRMDALRQDILKVMAEEVGVRDPQAVRPHVIALAEKAHDELVDYALKAFIQRTCDGSRDTNKWIDSLASLLGGRSLETWHDDTLLRYRAEFRRVFTLLTRIVALAKLTHKNNGVDHAVVAVHVVDQNGAERFVAVPSEGMGAMDGESVKNLRAVLDGLPVPSFVLARLLLEYSVDLPNTRVETNL